MLVVFSAHFHCTDVVFLLSDSSMMHSEQRQLANVMVPGITGYPPQGLVYCSLLVLKSCYN